RAKGWSPIPPSDRNVLPAAPMRQWTCSDAGCAGHSVGCSEMGLRHRLRLRAARDPRQVPDRFPVVIHLAREAYLAGETVVALVDGIEAPGRVALVRVERKPGCESAVLVDEQCLGEPHGVVELTLPRCALPTAEGSECALSYAVQVRAKGLVARAGL